MAPRTWRRHGILFLSALIVLSTVGCKKDKAESGKAESGVVDTNAETAAPASVSAWGGTLRWEHQATAKLNEETYRASVEYRNVAPTSSGDAGYRADVTVDYIRTWLFNCHSGGQTRIEEKQNYSGPYPLPGPYTGDDPNLKAQREGAALVLDSRPEGVWFDTQPMFLELRATTSCPNEAAGDSTAIAVSNDLLDAPSRLTGDSDPDPDHLVGTTEWTPANPPEKTLGDWESWSFRVTYDLRRLVVDTDGDGIPDTVEGGPGVDTDGDGTPDYKDLDSDNDGVSDATEGADDSDRDGTPDYRDPDGGNGGGADDGGGEDDDREKVCEKPEENPVVCYAPLVRFHPDEVTFPMDIHDFVANSRLMWNRDHDCDEEEVAAVIYLDRIGRTATDPYTAQEAGWPGCTPSGRPFAANELTKPGQDGKADGLDKEEGFYLDLADDRRLGAVPVEKKVQASAYYSISPDRRHITYWFMYGFNQGAPGTGSYVDRHEGEWERITVDLWADGTARHVRYWQHECTEPETVPYEQVKTVGTHPVVYSALGSHASFPDVRSVDKNGLCPLPGLFGELADLADVGQGWGDITDDEGAEWETWATSLSDAARAPWYGFGGAWGEIGGHEKHGRTCQTREEIVGGCTVDVTGPLGPHHKNLFAYP